MRIKFLGASGTVTGSGYFLQQDNGRGIVVDLGMFQGPEQVSKLNYLPLELPVDKVDAVIVTHAHLDHCGRLPLLTKKGFGGKFHMTAPTKDLVELVLFDSAKIAQRDDEVPVIYDADDVARTLGQIQVENYHKRFDVSGFVVEMFDAGHLLGSASLHITDKDSGKKIVFSGDLGNSPQRIVRPTEVPPDADVVIMETTYGNREHPLEDSNKIIAAEINAAESANSTLLIPSFAMNKTQDILNRIKHLRRKGFVSKSTPVFLDSPMAIKATRIAIRHKKFFNSILAAEAKKSDPFSFHGLSVVERHNKSKRIHGMKGGKIIIAGSGMMSGGRILHHAAEYLPLSETRLLIVGYQAEETLGREIVEGAQQIEIDGEPVDVKASITRVQGMSSHAGQSALVKWLGSIKGVRQVFLTHGDPEARQAFAKKIADKVEPGNVVLPKINDDHHLI